MASLLRLAAIVCALCIVAAAGEVASARAATETLTFHPEADTYVTAADPGSTHGRSLGMSVDRAPAKEAFVRFRLSGIEGRRVTAARLRLQQVDASRTGGRVASTSSTGWSERGMSWESRPTIDGPELASFGRVENGQSYEVEIDGSSLEDGAFSLGISSSSSDGARWASRESATPPRLEVEVERDPDQVRDGLSEVAAPTVGSSEPTYYAANHRAAVTSEGRTLAVYGRHGSGLQLAWRNPDGAWRTRTNGTSADGTLTGGTSTGDWPASIVVGRDDAGREHAWVVWAGQNASSQRSLRMLRLTDLDSPDGPRVGEAATVDDAPRGAYRPDVALERDPGGARRVAVLWSRRVADTSYEIVTGWVSDLGSDVPSVGNRSVIERSSSSAHFGTLTSTERGLRSVARVAGGLRLYGHDSEAPLGDWFEGTSGPAVASSSSPSAVGVSGGDVLVAVDRDPSAADSAVYRFASDGSGASTELRLPGYGQPSIASDGGSAWVVGVRRSDGFLVSREMSSGGGWSADDRVEIGPEGGGHLAWPNLVREVDGRLRLIVEGPNGSSTRSSVLAFQRER